MADKKAFYQSRGVTGSLTAIALSAFMLISAGVKHYTHDTPMPTFDNIGVIHEIAQGESEQTEEMMVAFGALLASFRGLAGRLNAKTDVALRKPKPTPE